MTCDIKNNTYRTYNFIRIVLLKTVCQSINIIVTRVITIFFFPYYICRKEWEMPNI